MRLQERKRCEHEKCDVREATARDRRLREKRPLEAGNCERSDREDRRLREKRPREIGDCGRSERLRCAICSRQNAVAMEDAGHIWTPHIADCANDGPEVGGAA